jgi:hypothetical protein
MKEAKDLNFIESSIYYWNKMVAVIFAIGISYIGGIVPIIGGYVVYQVLWFGRKQIYTLGLSRFYFLAIVFYLSLFFSIFISLDYRHYWLIPPTLKLEQIDAYFSYVITSLPKLLHWRHVIFSFAIGVVLYVLNVEFSRNEILDRDLMSIQVNRRELNSLGSNIHAGFLIILCVSLYFVSWVALILVIALELGLCQVNKRLRVGLLVVLIFILLTASVKSHFYLANKLWEYALTYGVVIFLNAQLSGIYVLFVASAFYWLLPYVTLKLIFELFYNNEAGVQTIEKIAQLNYIEGDFRFGTSLEDGSFVNLTDKELNQHMFIIGTTGSGKTVAILNMVIRAAKQNYPMIFLDGKGEVGLVDRLAKIAQAYNRTLKVFTLRPEAIGAEYLATYNPFASGTFTEWKNRILALFAEVKGKGQQHFALLEEDLINTVAQVMFRANKNIDLTDLYYFLSEPSVLVLLARKYGDERLIQKVECIDQELVKDVAIMLSLFIESSYGKLFATENSNVIRLREAITNNEMILFLLDSSAYKSDTEKIAKLIINDINATFAELLEPKTSYCIFDEFASYASSNLSDTLSLMRSKGMCAIVGTQSIVSVSLKSEETKRVAEELKSCCNTYLCLAINNEQDAEIMGKIYNTRDGFEVTTQIDASIGGATGMGSSKVIKEFNVHPEQLKNLTTSEGFLYRKVAKLKPIKIKVHNSGY